MTAIWDQSVDVLKEAMLAYAYLFNGNLGAGILAVTFLARLALLPVTLRLARLTSAHQKAMQRLQPDLDELKRRYASDPRRLHEETQKTFSRAGISPVPIAGCLGALAQAPALIALYSAVRRVAMMGGPFAWIRNISQPNVILTVVVAAIGTLGTLVGPPPSAENRTVLMLLPTIVTMLVLWKMAAGVALYWGMSNAFSVAQGLAINAGRVRSRD
jgi:YidC/Oxa1 family membrane protein insertase